jgi:uncharacterized protein (UPF0548 family)
VGRGAVVFDKARTGLQQWAAHRGSGVEVFAVDAGVVPGSTVAVLTRQLQRRASIAYLDALEAWVERGPMPAEG